MKIIHAISAFTTGGSETLLVDILNRQCKENEVSLIIIKDLVDNGLLQTIDQRVNVFLLRQKGNLNRQFFPLFIKINAIVAPIGPDVIHCHDNTLFPFFIRWKQKTCFTVHGFLSSHLFFKQYRRVFAVSKAVQANVKQCTGLDAPLVYNGIAIAEYLPRTTYQLDAGAEFKIVQLGRLCPEQKGQHKAIQSIHLLKQQYPEIRFRLYVVGTGNALPELQAQVKSCHLQNEVIFVGQVDRCWVKNRLRDYHLLIQPSLIEGFGLTVVEGLACGLPVIAGNRSGPKEIVECLNTGLLIDPDRADELASGILKVYWAYQSNSLWDSNYLVHDKVQLSIFDINTTVQTYLENYKSL